MILTDDIDTAERCVDAWYAFKHQEDFATKE